MDREFYERNARIVAKELLGKILVRKINGKLLKARIVETESYFDEKDPASRARQNGDLRKTMLMGPGTILVYGVHSNWLVNIVTDRINVASAVLIRAVEPINFDLACNGPGLLTKALEIGKGFHKKSIFNNDDNNSFWIVDGDCFDLGNGIEVVEKNRIGVKNDLKEPNRFYIKNNIHVSRK